LLWSGLFIFGGFWFGNIPLVKDHFGLVVLVVIFISLIPLIKEIIFYYWAKRKNNN